MTGPDREGAALFRRRSRASLPGKASSVGAHGTSTLVTLCDFPEGFDDKHIVDVCISAPSGGGSVPRVLSRQRQTLRAAVQQACTHAEQLAQAGGETIVAPGQRPSLAHLADGEGGCTICLNYDLGPRGQVRPRVVRSLALFVVVRREGGAEPVAPTPAARPLAAGLGSRSRPPPV